MNSSLRELEVFRLVMELGSVTAAAAALNISQPAVSRTLQQTEQRLGFALFTRRKKRLVPTAEGDALYLETRNVFAALEAVDRRGRDLRDGSAGTLAIATIAAFANAVLPEALRRFLGSRPNVAVSVQVSSAQDVAERVAGLRADLGLIIDSVAVPGISLSDLCATDFGGVMPRGHPLAGRGHLSPRDLEGERLICLSRHLPLGTQAARVFADADIPLRIAVEVSHSTVACALVRKGVGIALLDRLGFMSAPGEDLLLQPFTPRISIAGRLVQPRHRPPSRLAQDFIATLREVILPFAADQAPIPPPHRESS
jgi:DNA-binding transcriptional LysR family regulator